MARSGKEKIKALEIKRDQINTQLRQEKAREATRERKRRTHRLIQLGGIVTHKDVFGYDEELWGDAENRQRLLRVLLAHARQLREWARQEGVTIPFDEPMEEKRETGWAPEPQPSLWCGPTCNPNGVEKARESVATSQ